MANEMMLDPMGNPTGYQMSDVPVAPAKEPSTKNNNPGGLASWSGILAKTFAGVSPIIVSPVLAVTQTVLGATASPETQAEFLRKSEDPSKIIFERMAQQEQFKTAEGKKQLEDIKGDQAFVSALNDAVKKDPSVAEGLIKLSAGGDQGKNFQSLGKDLQDPKNRAVFTKLLNKVAESPDDKFNFDYINSVGDAVRKKEHRKAKDLLGEAGIKDSRLDLSVMFENPGQALMQLFKNPRQFFAQLTNALGLDGAQGAAWSKIFNGASTAIEAYHPTARTQRTMAQVGKIGEDLIGITDENARKRPPGNITTTVKVNNEFTNSASGTTPTAPTPAVTPAPQPQIPAGYDR